MKRAFLATAVLCLLSLLLPLGLNGQTVTAISGMAINQYGQPSPFASVRVCLVTTGGNPCDTTGVTLYYDYSQGIKAPNPYSADQYGNYSVYATGATTPNVYLVEVTPAPPQSGGPFSYLFNGAGGSSGGGGVNPSLLPQPLCFYATVGSTCSPTLVGANLGPAYYPSLGPSVAGALFSPDEVAQLPKIDVRSPNFGIPAGCANGADSLGVLDSTCAINAAFAYGVTVFGSGSTSRPMPCVYIPAGTYLISGPIIMTNQWSLCGDGPVSTRIVQSNLTSNIITVRAIQNQPFSPNPQGWSGGGFISGLGLSCAVSGTPGSTFNGCTGNAIEVQGTDFQIDNTTLTNWGGRGVMASSAEEQLYISRMWQNETRWPISNAGQANLSLDDWYAAGPGQTSTYCWGAMCHLGYSQSLNWNPTAVSIASMSVDGSGNWSASIASSDPIHGYTSGQSSPVPPDGYVTFSGITDAGLTDINGTFQILTTTTSPSVAISSFTGSSGTLTFTTGSQSFAAGLKVTLLGFSGGNAGLNGQIVTILSSGLSSTSFEAAVTGSAYSSGTGTVYPPFQITGKTYDQAASGALWVYSDNDEPMWFCGNNVSCPILSPASYSASNPTGNFQVATFPAVNNTMQVQTVVGHEHNLRIDILTHAQGIADSSNGNHIDGVYAECVATTGPCLQRAYQGGRYLPYTTLTQATNTSGIQSLTVNNGSWFPIATGDPGNIYSIAGSNVNWVIYPPDYNPYQTGVASCCVAGVNTNQYEFVTGAMDTTNVLHITARNQGGTAPSGVAWPIGSLLDQRFFGFQAISNTINLQRQVGNYKGSSGNGFYDGHCSDLGPNICADLINGGIPNFRTQYPMLGGPNVTIDNYLNFSAPQGDPAAANAGGSNCMKILGGNVTFNGVSPVIQISSFGQMAEGTGIVNGIARHLLSSCIVMVQQNINGTLTLPSSTAVDEATNTRYFCDGTTAPGCGFDSNVRTGLSYPSFGGSTAGLPNVFTGYQFAPAYDVIDGNVVQASAAITAWSIPSISSNATNNLTLTTTLNPGFGNCVQITGLTVGAIFNNTGQCWHVQSSTSTQTIVGTPVLGVPASLPLSATESGTVSVLKPTWKYHCQGGPTFTGTNVGCDWDIYSGTGSTYNAGLKLRQDSTPGVLDISDLSTTNWTFNGNLSFIRPFPSLTVSGVSNLGFTFAGPFTNLVSWSWAIGTGGTHGWANASYTVTLDSTDIADPTGSFLSTKLVSAASPTTNTLTDQPGYTLSSGQPYSFGFYAYALTAPFTVQTYIGNILTNVTVAAGSWNFYCVTASPTGSLSNVAALQIQNASIQTLYVFGATLVPGSKCGAPWPTGAGATSSGVPSMAATNLYGTLTDVTQAAGAACFSASGVLSSSGCTSGAPLVATLTTTAATSDNLTVTGMTASGHCALSPTNASAATNIATTYVSAKTTNQITVTHTATASMTYDFLCTAN